MPRVARHKPIPHSSYLSRTNEIYLHYPPKPASALTPAWEDIPHNVQVQRFVLLYFLLKQSSLCNVEIQTYLSKYVHTLSNTALQQLRLHLPNVGLLHRKEYSHIFKATLEGLQALGPKHGPRCDPPTLFLFKALTRATLQLTGDPVSFYHVDDGWWFTLAADLSIRNVYLHHPIFGRAFSHRGQSFWFGELSNAVYLGIICRLLLFLGKDDPYIVKNKLAIKEAWRNFFRVFTPPPNPKYARPSNNKNTFSQPCTCDDRKKHALPAEDYYYNIQPEMLSKKFSGLEIGLIKYMKLIDTLPSDDSKFQLEDLYSVDRQTARPVRRHVFDKSQFTPELYQIINERLPQLTLNTILRCAEWNVNNHGFSALDRGAHIAEEVRPKKPSASVPKDDFVRVPRAAKARPRTKFQDWELSDAHEALKKEQEEKEKEKENVVVNVSANPIAHDWELPKGHKALKKAREDQERKSNLATGSVVEKLAQTYLDEILKEESGEQREIFWDEDE